MVLSLRGAVSGDTLVVFHPPADGNPPAFATSNQSLAAARRTSVGATVADVAGLRLGLVVTFVSLVGGVGATSAGPASGQEPATTTTAPGSGQVPGGVVVDDVAAAVAAEGWYADPTVTADRSALAALAGRLSSRTDLIGFAVLAQEPDGSSTAYAEEVLDALPARGELGIETVAVLSPDDVGVVSDTWDENAIDVALDDAVDELRSDPVQGLEALTDALARQATMADGDAGDAGDDGDGGLSAGWVVVGAIALVAVVGSRWLLPRRAGDGYRDDDGWGSSYGRRRSRWRSSSRSSLFGGSRRSGGSRSRRSSGGSRRGRGGRRL